MGITGDVRQKSLEVVPLPQIYLCAPQYGMEGGSYVFRAPAGQTSASQAAVAAVDGKLQSIRVKPMWEFVQHSLADRRTAAFLLGLLALVALGLTAVGIYGVISFVATQRAPEMSIRMALGAQSSHVVRLIVGQGIRLAAIGILIGAAGSVWAGWLLRAHLYDTEPLDPVSIGAAAALLLATACGAGWHPAAGCQPASRR